MAKDLTPHYENLADWQVNRSAELQIASNELLAVSRDLAERSREAIRTSLDALRRTFPRGGANAPGSPFGLA